MSDYRGVGDHFDREKYPVDGGGGRQDRSGGLRLYAPPGRPPRERVTYTLGAYRVDARGREEAAAVVRVFRRRCNALAAADVLAYMRRRLPAWATHLIVTTSRGREVYRRPVLRVRG